MTARPGERRRDLLVLKRASAPSAAESYDYGSRPAASPTTSPIDPPTGTRNMGALKVIIGTQTFTCVNGSFAAASVPEADLAGRGGRIHHFKGPSWQSERDGSTITAAKVAERPRAGTIPELLLQVSS